MREMLAMMKGFLADFRRYRHQLRHHDTWVRRYASAKGYQVNPRWMVYTNLKLWLADSEEMYGRRICPCFEPSGDPALDKKLICPCAFLAEELEQRGWCHCTLFGRADLTAADFKRAEDELMAEYRGTPLTWRDGMLDTRGHHIEPLRGLPVPDAIHQVKRSINGRGLPITAIVGTREEASHLERLGELRGYEVSVAEESDGTRVTIEASESGTRRV